MPSFPVKRYGGAAGCASVALEKNERAINRMGPLRSAKAGKFIFAAADG